MHLSYIAFFTFFFVCNNAQIVRGVTFILIVSVLSSVVRAPFEIARVSLAFLESV